MKQQAEKRNPRSPSCPQCKKNASLTSAYFGIQKPAFQNNILSLFHTFAVFWMLYYFFWAWNLCADVSEHRFVFIGGVSRSASEDGGECSETSARKFQTPGNHQKERIQQHNPCFFNLENYTLKMEAPGSYETLMCKYKTVTGELDIREVPDFILWVRTRVSFT